MLFKTLTTPDRSQTQLAYKIKYWPVAKLSSQAKELIAFQKRVFLKKETILAGCNDEKNKLKYCGREYQIVWAYNNMPTEKEWDGKSADYLISCEFRSSPAIPGFAVVILSFELPVRQYDR